MNKKKKILFLVTQSEFGGAQRFIYTLIEGLCVSAIDYEVVVGAGPEGDDRDGLLFALENKGIKTVHLKNLKRSINPFFDILGLFEIKKILNKEKPDILFLCSSKAGAIGSIAAVLNSKFQNPNFKVIYRIGGWTFNDPWPNWKKKLYIWIEKTSAKWKDYIINNAELDRKQAIKLGIKPKEKIMTIYNGIDIKEMKFFPREEARSILKIKKGFIAGTIANLYPSKGIKYLVEAAKAIDAEFVIIGKGKKEQKGNISFLGDIPEAYKYLKAFDIFVLPSVKEGFPWTILEAMVAEVPIVATKVGAIPEIIQDKKTGLLVKPGDAKDLSKAIIELIENKSLALKLVNQAKKIIEKQFTLKNMVNEIEKLL